MKKHRLLIIISVLSLVLVGNFALAGTVYAGTEGLTPGFWKNHTDAWCEGIDPGDSFAVTAGITNLDWLDDRGIDTDITMMEALEAKGNKNKNNALLRHAAAALLNGCSDFVNYAEFSTVQDWVQGAFNPTSPWLGYDWERWKDFFEEKNERGLTE